MFPAKRWHVQPTMVWPDESEPRRACTVCRTPTVWKRPRKLGAAVHPSCEAVAKGNAYSPFDAVTDELHMSILFSIVTQLGAAVITEEQTETAAPVRKRLGNPDAGCELCGRGHAGLWVGARTWRCPEHPPADETYRRKWQ
jgi:hypothetical protein